MKLIVLHPGAAAIDCDDCKRWLYDLETGKKCTVKVGPERVETPQPRPKGTPTPCKDCPKESPEKAEEMKLTEANLKTYQLWKMAKATHFNAVPDRLKNDLVMARHFAELDELHTIIQQRQQEQLIARLSVR